LWWAGEIASAFPLFDGVFGFALIALSLLNLSSVAGQLTVEWMNPATGAKTAGAAINGGTTIAFAAPFSGDAVLDLKGKTSGATSR